MSCDKGKHAIIQFKENPHWMVFSNCRVKHASLTRSSRCITHKKGASDIRATVRPKVGKGNTRSVDLTL
ncbi:MAG: hypothetical protein ACP5U1_14095 [Desulfomonilaceae bacterium]